jgi:hypothetical protein
MRRCLRTIVVSIAIFSAGIFTPVAGATQITGPIRHTQSLTRLRNRAPATSLPKGVLTSFSSSSISSAGINHPPKK